MAPFLWSIWLIRPEENQFSTIVPQCSLCCSLHLSFCLWRCSSSSITGILDRFSTSQLKTWIVHTSEWMFLHLILVDLRMWNPFLPSSVMTLRMWINIDWDQWLRSRTWCRGLGKLWIPTFETWLLINDSWEWPCCLTFTVGSLLFIHCWHIGNYGPNISSFATKDLTWIYNNLKLKCWCGKGRGGKVKTGTQISCATQPVWCNSLRSRCLHISKVTQLLLRHKWPIF